MNDIFRECRERVSAQDAARFYGFEPNRAGFIRCPFHQGDETPSLKLYSGDRGWFCFGCGKGGSVVDFVSRLFGLEPLEAVRRLNDDLGLRLPIDRPQTAQEAQRRRDLSAAHELFEAWRTDLIRQLNGCFREGHFALKNGQDVDKLTEREALATKWQPVIEHWTDCLLNGDMAAQMDIFRDRKEVEQVCDRILNNSQTKSGVA